MENYNCDNIYDKNKQLSYRLCCNKYNCRPPCPVPPPCPTPPPCHPACLKACQKQEGNQKQDLGDLNQAQGDRLKEIVLSKENYNLLKEKNDAIKTKMKADIKELAAQLKTNIEN